jgi:putative transposase
VIETLHSERFMDKAPAQVWATLLDEKTYLCSPRTMYRILAEHGEVRERRNQLRHPNYTKPELLAEAPNQVWSWDITKLLGPVKWTYFYLYVILDIFSRYVVGWMVAHRESAALARRLIETACRNQSIEPGQLTIHADRGASMRSKSLALLLADLGVAKTHSRPHVSNDNPYSESQFKTLKYCPQFPERFGSIQDARAFGGPFFDYYNNEHRHSGIGLMTPAAVHYGMAKQLTAARQETLLAAYRSHPCTGRLSRPNCRARLGSTLRQRKRRRRIAQNRRSSHRATPGPPHLEQIVRRSSRLRSRRPRRRRRPHRRLLTKCEREVSQSR